MKNYLSSKSLILSISVTAFGAMFALPASAATSFEPNAQSIFEKKLTKAQCLRKDGYAWDSSTKRCVKVTRGSY